MRRRRSYANAAAQPGQSAPRERRWRRCACAQPPPRGHTRCNSCPVRMRRYLWLKALTRAPGSTAPAHGSRATAALVFLSMVVGPARAAPAASIAGERLPEPPPRSAAPPRSLPPLRFLGAASLPRRRRRGASPRVPSPRAGPPGAARAPPEVEGRDRKPWAGAVYKERAGAAVLSSALGEVSVRRAAAGVREAAVGSPGRAAAPGVSPYP